MADSLLKSAEALRATAYEALKASEPFRAFKAMDDAVAAMGGRRLLSPLSGVTLNGVVVAAGTAAPPNPPPRRRLSQGDAAEIILREQGKPLVLTELLARVPEKGVTVGGENAQMNFGSTLSRDARFYSFRRDGLYYWWLSGVDLPQPFKNEAPDLPLQDGSGASSSQPSQEGGDAHAATTT